MAVETLEYEVADEEVEEVEEVDVSETLFKGVEAPGARSCSSIWRRRACSACCCKLG